jgi:hypothetical protein
LACEDISLLSQIRGDSDSTCFKESTLEVVKEVRRVLNANTETDKIFREAAGGASGCIDRSMAEKGEILPHESEGYFAHDIAQGILIKLLTHPKLTLIPHNRVAPTIASLIALSPVVKLNTAPGPSAILSCTSRPGWSVRPG